MDINLLNGNVHRYKKEGCSGNFFILGCTGCPWQRLGITKKSLSPQKKKKAGFFSQKRLFFAYIQFFLYFCSDFKPYKTYIS